MDYELAFDNEGRIHAVDATYAARCGFSSDLSGPVTDRALFHADSSYFYPHVHLTSMPLKTHTPSNTAFRGFGGPQGMLGAERFIEEIAYAIGKDPLEIRKLNFYGQPGSGRTTTPYHQEVEDNIILRIVEELEESANYQARRNAIIGFNRDSRYIRKGIALTPVKFGISFTMTAFNQAGALVHIYQDGSIHLNHGGTEMGQGLYTKVAQVLSDSFQVDIDRVKITATTTGKVPNTSATAASSGSDLNGMAAYDAARQIKERLVAFAADKWSVDPAEIVFLPNRVRVGEKEVPFPDFIKQAYFARVQLSAAGFYKTPKIHWDRAAGRGTPFYYFAYGAACTRSLDRHTDRRIPDRPHRHPARRRPLAESGDRHRPGGRRLRAGHGLADDGRTLVGRQGPAAHACALDLQDPACLRPAEDLQRPSRRMVGERRAHHRPLEGRRRTAAHAGDLRARSTLDGGGKRRRLQGLPTARRPGNAGAGADGGGADEAGVQSGRLS